MVKLDMFCGLLGAGKTTLIKQMLSGVYPGYRVAIIENEFGKVNLDASELESASIQVRELTSGCICCTVKGDLMNAVGMLIRQEVLDYIIVEASGVADLRALLQVSSQVEGVVINRVITVVNGKKILKLLKVVGNFFMDQIRVSNTVYLNFCEGLSPDAIGEAEKALREINPALKSVSIPLDRIGPDTFPDGETQSVPKSEAPKAFGRLAAGRRMGQVRRAGTGGELSLENWDYVFAKPFTPDQVEHLIRILQDESHHQLWRAKGYLEMTDGSIRKVDYTFGDAFEDDRDTVAEEHKNLLVLIGPELDEQWLEEQFTSLFDE